jgi:TPR repeat protein
MRIFEPSALILSVLAASGAAIWHAPMALAQSQPEPIAVIASPLPSPVVASPLPPLPIGRSAPEATLTNSSTVGHPLTVVPAGPQSMLPASTGESEVIATTPAYAPALNPRLAEPFKSMRDAFTKGMKGYNAGDKADAVRAFAYAAAQGHVMSCWKLARMYAEGDGVRHDDLKAFEYYSRTADADTDEGSGSPNARFIANAYVALGTYFLDGIPNTYVKADPVRARDLFKYAASLYGDPDAQYNLARMLADGTGGPKDIREAVRWLNLAAEKNHRPSQALLGHILFTGNGVPRQAAQGLMWLSLAREGADPTKDAWITQLRDQAFAAANENERQLSTLYLDQHSKR